MEGRSIKTKIYERFELATFRHKIEEHQDLSSLQKNMIEGLLHLRSVGAKRVFLQVNCCKKAISSKFEREHENNSQHQSNKVTQ